MYRYESVAGQVREWIATGTLKPGDRLLSVRDMAVKLGYSTVTVHQAYGVLQIEGLLEVRPRSGFFISDSARQLPEFASEPADFSPEDTEPEAVDALLSDFDDLPREGLAGTAISSDLTPAVELYRLMSSALRREVARHEEVPWQGLDALREVIARRLGAWAPSRRMRDITVTPDVAAALDLCLNLLAKPGEKVLVETPTDPATVTALLGRGLGIVEIYSHPRFGLDPDQLEYLLDTQDIAVCILSPINHVPTGVSYSLDVAQRLVDITGRRSVPIIENLAAQALLYNDDAPVFDLTAFDTRNLVFQIGGFAGTLGPRFGVGWVALPGKYRLNPSVPAWPRHGAAGQWAHQRAIADFVGKRSYDRHLHVLQQTLAARVRKGMSLISQRFPDTCTVSRPSGGYMCWVRGPKNFSALSTSSRRRDRPTFIPGPMYSVTRAFGNFLALNLSSAWTPQREDDLMDISRMLARLS